MSSYKSIRTLLICIALLLIANLVRPLLEPGTAFAAKEEQHEEETLAIPGGTGWVIKGDTVYYLKYDRQSDRIWTYSEVLR